MSLVPTYLHMLNESDGNMYTLPNKLVEAIHDQDPAIKFQRIFVVMDYLVHESVPHSFAKGAKPGGKKEAIAAALRSLPAIHSQETLDTVISQLRELYPQPSPTLAWLLYILTGLKNRQPDQLMFEIGKGIMVANVDGQFGGRDIAELIQKVSHIH